MFAARSGRFLSCAVAALIAVAFLTPGSHAGLFGPSTPQEKLSDALYLASGPGRIAAARKEIEEVRAECEKSGEKACLADVYRLYGLLERSGATKEIILMRRGIYAVAPTSENIDRARPYFDKAIELATEARDFGTVANVYYEFMVNEKERGTPQAGCVYADRLLDAVHEGQKQHPGERVSMPPQFKTAEEWIAAIEKELGCPVN